MRIEHIARGRYIVDYSDMEWQELKKIAVAFHNGNLCTSIRQINEGGIKVYRDILEEGFVHDKDYEKSVKVLAEHLVEQEEENQKGTKFGSAIDSSD